MIMLDYDSWQQVKEQCHNEDQVSFHRMSPAAQVATKNAHTAGAIIQTLRYDGVWVSSHDVPSWHPGIITRVSPSWPGPAKPEPKSKYMDAGVETRYGAYKVEDKRTSVGWFLSDVQNCIGFAGYVYEINGKEKLRPRLLFDQQPDGTYRLRVPKAVRFLKGAVA
jgi:hypothetical protein